LALVAQNLAVISWLISYISPSDLFSASTASTSSPLSQHVLISVIQQVGCSLQQQQPPTTASVTTVPAIVTRKLEWLHYCLFQIKPQDSAISPFVKQVLEELQGELTQLPGSTQKAIVATTTQQILSTLH